MWLFVVVRLCEVEDGGDAATHVLDRGAVPEESRGCSLSVSTDSHVHLCICFLSQEE